MPFWRWALEPMALKMRLDWVSMRERARAASSASSAETANVMVRVRLMLETPSRILSFRISLKTAASDFASSVCWEAGSKNLRLPISSLSSGVLVTAIWTVALGPNWS